MQEKKGGPYSRLQTAKRSFTFATSEEEELLADGLDVSKPLSGRSLLQQPRPPKRGRGREHVSKPLSGRSLLQHLVLLREDEEGNMSPNR